MKNGELLYLSKNDVEAAGLTMGEIIELVETAFREKGKGRVEMPPKPGIHPGEGDNFIHAMPAYIPAMKSAGMKWVSGYPENQKHGLPYITGLLILNDPETGLPKAVMDCVWITAMRTAAATAVAARRLARSDSAVLGILGCGVQGLTNTEALQTVFPIKKVVGYDVNRDALYRFTGEIRKRFELKTEEAATPREAVTGCDIIVTAGPILKNPHATIKAGWMDEGTFASLVDFDSYWHPDAMNESDKFCTDHRAAQSLPEYRLFPGHSAGFCGFRRTGCREETGASRSPRTDDGLQPRFSHRRHGCSACCLQTGG